MFKVGDKVMNLYRSPDLTGVGTVVALSKKSKRAWVKWDKVQNNTLESLTSLQNLPEPATLLKELL